VLNLRSGMPEPLFRSLVIQLAREFKRRGMERHVWALRRYYADHLRRQREGSAWTETLLVEWLCLMRIPPFHRVYEVLPRGASCPVCSRHDERGSPSMWVETAFPGGAKVHCRCGMSWLTTSGR
jgi:hypothetical protein